MVPVAMERGAIVQLLEEKESDARRRVPDRLDRYREKRDPGRTPEPFGAGRAAPGEPAGAGGPAPGSAPLRLFVVQKHAARRLHWDFRLELGGTLRSWAVPKGPSADPADKRMAVEVEDHPVEYADFEGTIPAGNYGAGAVVVWDRGAWAPVGDAEAGLAAGKLVFQLHGYKLRGEWTLVRTRRAGGQGRTGKHEWLLLKHKGDAFAGPGRPFPEESVFTGRLVEEVAAGGGRAAAAVDEAARLGAPVRALGPRALAPMLAEPVEEAFDDPAWLFELKYDGYRMLARRAGADVELRTRSGDDATARYPEVAKALELLPVEATIDGEVVVLGPDGTPSFQGLQGRAGLTRREDVARAALAAPATLFAFDLLALGGRDLRGLPLRERKRLLAEVVPRLGPLRFADHVEGRGVALLREVAARGLEGIVAKRADAPYRSGRGAAWRKIRLQQSGDFAVVGFTAPRGGRSGLGALLLASARGGGLTFAGSVGSGLADRDLADLRARLAARARSAPPCDGAVPRSRGITWVEPELVAEVRYAEVTQDGVLRQPVFLRLRDDKRVEEATGATVRETDEGAAAGDGRGKTVASRSGAGKRKGTGTGTGKSTERPEVKVSNPDKIYFPGEGITKGELVAYHREIAPFMLPFLRDRPLVLTRFPDGILGKSFFQKDAPSWRPGWIRTVTVHAEEANRDLEHFLVDDADGLAWLANLGVIPIHVFSSRAPALERPDWCIIDLDPKEAPFAHVVRLAKAVRALCDDLGLPSYPKTTGQKGLHVLLPLGGQLTHEQARTLGELVARAVEAELPELSTTARAIPARRGRVYLDYLQNGYGKTIAAPYTVRPRPGAPVSTPLRWSEVGPRLDPSRFTIRTARARAERLGADPLAPVLTERPDLLSALARLKERLERAGAGAGAR
jgi:bifunctional non-homologous end joining protein LigD